MATGEQAIELTIDFGNPILRAYADFSIIHTRGWEKPTLKHGIRTINQLRYNSKNSYANLSLAKRIFSKIK
ncbi:hypothetical protein, partial [Endozoicomonas sp. ALC013]|uniref:hypothetical protein n=1 Tax=Endozoicomonas sp. ALC013 TaxID=3403076 RepID=UPI003BB4F109